MYILQDGISSYMYMNKIQIHVQFFNTGQL